jgi:hypothetical protein
MYENCCDPGIKMPSLYLQTFGARSYSTDYDFSWKPDAMIINLGVRASPPPWSSCSLSLAPSPL